MEGVDVSGREAEIMGLLPPGFRFDFDIWIVLGLDDAWHTVEIHPFVYERSLPEEFYAERKNDPSVLQA